MRSFVLGFLSSVLISFPGVVLSQTEFAAQAATADQPAPGWCRPLAGAAKRTVCADVVALDQTLVYNRFGTFNPFGMMFALRRDVISSAVPPESFTADACDRKLGTEESPQTLSAGQVRLKDCKRPRPLVLRTNVGDILHVRLTNLLRPEQPDLSRDFCRRKDSAPSGDHGFFQSIRDWVSSGEQAAVDHGEAMCASDRPEGETAQTASLDWPRSRGLNFAIQGLTAVDENGAVSAAVNRVCTGLAAIQPGSQSVDCYYRIDREGPYFIASNAAPAGGEGDGGSITHGLFGAVVAEQAGTSWFRSQISSGAFKKLWPAKAGNAARHAIDADGLQTPYVAYQDLPGADETRSSILSLLRKTSGNAYEIIHADLNAIIYRAPNEAAHDEGVNFREFSVFFHDELKSFFTRNFEELSRFGAGQLAGVRDGFAINYGSSGMGTMLIANRKGIGPAANCKECLYEEFFLTSWANGDPALLEQFGDDPSNVHHSYLNDRIVFRNFHAGPKETHVFHLHAHQWFAGNDPGRGSYLDSQTVAPQQGFTYDIYGGGLNVYHKGAGGRPGWYETLGSGNRNRTVGDSIFHCHLYPHFAQGMWELWRVHDVLEDGTRKLPDGQKTPGFSLQEASDADKRIKRPGSVDPATGAWIADGAKPSSHVGTPIPALVPLPGQAWPLLPTYSGEKTLADAQSATQAAPAAAAITSMPGYPFYIAGKPGHRPPQAPNDIAGTLADDGGTGTYLDGGLPRHVLTDDAERKADFKLPEKLGAPFDGATDRTAREKMQAQAIAKTLAMGDMTLHIEKARIDTLPYAGSALEKTGMAFHHNGRIDGNGAALDLRMADGTPAAFQTDQGGYASLIRAAVSGRFAVNGAPPKPGAPFADPCGAPDGFAQAKRDEGGRKYVFTRTAANGQAVTFDLMALDEGQSAPVTPDKLRPAADQDITNWTKWRRTDPVADEQGELQPRQQRPALYYVENGQVAEFPLVNNIMVAEADPFMDSAAGLFTTDPALVGFRRYRGSAVQLDLVTNRAGWHDPQARINVLTRNSDLYKEGSGRISPRISGDEEPFFFRALSGECIEYRHTNELPKSLELDDFQVKTPTDTIGQHIHLVKFDVTASDGSGNGFNYEDGTLAPDEIAQRICAAKNEDETQVVSARGDGEARIREFAGLCAQDGDGHWSVAPQYKDKIWTLKLTQYRDLFQTTVQRWFADPILSRTNIADEGAADRTLKTVFSHDHFGPSSIQQHGFYTALVIEPQSSRTCRTGKRFVQPNGETATGDDIACTDERMTRGLTEASDIDVGAARLIRDPDAVDQGSRDYREFALAVADFATLYDPRDRMSKKDLLALSAPRTADAAAEAEIPASAADAAKGMATLVCEAKYAIAGQPGNMRRWCVSLLAKDATGWFSPSGDASPAWVAAAMPGDARGHRGDLANILDAGEIARLENHMLTYRARAAGYDSADGEGPRLAKAVAAPRRPESISVDHHDPYLVNYRGEPLPLRVGESRASTDDCALQPLGHWAGALATGVREKCSVDRQRPSPQGDMANVFQSQHHGDPATPVLETYTGERVLFRLIQGAQEVQHTLSLEGYNWPRNIDQKFPSAMRPLEDEAPADTLLKACENEKIPGANTTIMRAGRADQYQYWIREGAKSSRFTPDDQAFWKEYEKLIANCFNAGGQITAQEVGISEHFELAGAYRNDFSAERVRPARRAAALAPAGGEAVLVKAINDKTPTDTLVHFGSVDALWNGAWGLLRVYKDTKAADPTAPISENQPEKAFHACVKAAASSTAGVGAIKSCIDGVKTVGERLEPLSTLRRPASGGSEAALTARRPSRTEAVSCKFDAPVVHATVVAIESRTVFGDLGAPIHDIGTAYGRGLYDRNGLFFGLLDTRDIVGSGHANDDAYLGNPDLWGKLKLSTILKAIRQAYSRPEPLVITVNAGDCVRLTVINALRNYNGTDGLLDDLGDAPMPRITPLNTEPQWSAGEPYRATDIGKNPEEHNMPLRFTQEKRDQLRGSARLAVLLPLPVIDHQQRVARPFGYNATGALASIAMPGGGDPAATYLSADDGSKLWGERSGQIEQTTFYAGRVGTPADFDVARLLTADNTNPALRLDFIHELVQIVGPALGLPSDATPNIQIVEISDPRVGDRTVLPLAYGGHLFQIQANLGAGRAGELGQLLQQAAGGTVPEELAARIDRLWRDYAELRVSEKLHFMPYAFGALPIKSAGDMIGHPLHGLIGAVNVVPQSARLDQASVKIADRETGPLMLEKCEQARQSDPRACTIHAVMPQRVASAATRPLWQGRSVVAYPAGTAGHTLREFTLFWQDGLNLRDRATADLYRPLGPVGRPRLVADCKICDDSYDLGDKGVNYRSPSFAVRLRKEPAAAGSLSPESHFDLNAYQFGNEFFALRPDETGRRGAAEPHVLRAEENDEVVIHVVHPGGRARQRAFVTIGQDYDDLFPGFGFPHAALVAPGKAVNAWLTRRMKPGCYLWHDGPTYIVAGGAWGLLDVVPQGEIGNPGVTSCARRGSSHARP